MEKIVFRHWDFYITVEALDPDTLYFTHDICHKLVEQTFKDTVDTQPSHKSMEKAWDIINGWDAELIHKNSAVNYIKLIMILEM